MKALLHFLLLENVVFIRHFASRFSMWVFSTKVLKKACFFSIEKCLKVRGRLAYSGQVLQFTTRVLMARNCTKAHWKYKMK